MLAPPPLGLVTAFSRDQPQKLYVQHRLRDLGAAVSDAVLRGGAWVYVAGSADKMPSEVAAALEEALATHGGLGAQGAAEWVRRMEATGRYQVEAWS